MIAFKDPYFLILLLIIPVMLYFHFRKIGKLSLNYSSLAGIKKIFKEKFSYSQHILFILKILTITLFIFALARPMLVFNTREIMSSGIDIMLVTDTSGSMQTEDYSYNGFPVQRISVVKQVVDDFIAKRPGDRIGLVVFGTEAFTQCPITLDHEILQNFINSMYIGMIGENTAIGSAISVAVKRLKDIKAKSKIIILLTDGISNSGQISPITASEIAKTFGIKIYTIGVGSNQGNDSQMGPTNLDESTLEKIAQNTGGLYFRATDTAKLQEIYTTIDKLEKSSIKIKEYNKNTDLFLNLLYLSLIVYVLQIILSNTIFSKLP